MVIKCILVGKTREKYIQLGEENFRKRIKHYIPLKWIIVKEEKITSNKAESQIKMSEFNRIKEKLESSDWIVALDITAKQKSSEEFASYFSEKMTRNVKSIAFVIGGTLGLSDEILKLAHEKLSLSKMTFTHEMTRLILLEQIYRAFTIIKHEKYHK